MPEVFETSVAQIVPTNIHDWDNLRGALTYRDKTDPNNILLINLTTFYFKFELERGPDILATYEINSGAMSTAFLSKGGASNATLDIKLMLEDIRDNHTVPGKTYNLIQKVIDDQGFKFVHIIYQISAKRH